MNQVTQKDEIVCHCLQVTEGVIRECIAAGKLTTIQQVTSACTAGGGCQSCHMLIQLFIDESQGKVCSVPHEETRNGKEPEKGFFGRLFNRKKSSA